MAEGANPLFVNFRTGQPMNLNSIIAGTSAPITIPPGKMPWTSFTPSSYTWSEGGTDPTVTTNAGTRYLRVSDTVFVNYDFTITAKGNPAGQNIQAGLPITSASYISILMGREVAIIGALIIGQVTANTVVMLPNATPAVNWRYVASGFYIVEP